MRKLTCKYFIPFLAVILLDLTSCTPGSCVDETEALVKAYFYKAEKLTAPDSLTIYGLGRDTSLIYNKAAKVTIARLPLDAGADSSSFVIINNGLKDTITFRYTTYPHLISKECGYTYFHTIEEPVYTLNGITSVLVRKNTITTANEENIFIYY
jgi:hypothetical protein